MRCISFLQGHYPRMRMPTRCMPAVTFQAEIPSKKANPLWTACVKISFFFFKKKSNWCTCPLTQGPSYVPTLQTNQNLTTKRRAANAPQREQQWEFYSRVSILQDAELKHPFASTALNIFFFYKLSHNPWAADQNHEVSLAVRFLTGTKSGEISSSKECGKRSSIYGYYSTINWS